MTLKSILIANRGEIAVRIVRAARELGIRAVQAHSEADVDSLAVRMADESVLIGPPQAAKSYLNVDALIRAAAATGVDAVHPGYGFLAENADFADAVEAAGLVFIGPSGDTIRQMGDKASAREVATRASVPVVPGSSGRIEDPGDAQVVARDLGFPIMIKAVAGGGGRGIRIATNDDDLQRLVPQAAAEAKAAFGDGGLYLEKFIARARHIEVQVLGDGTSVIHCYERECSLQRRRQKLWEEAPATAIPEETRRALCAAAVQLAQSVKYRGAGTVEFLYDDESAEFFFIEMNTRIQVEHPVTELVTGIDLVQEMLRIAAGEPLRFDQEDISVRGHAIEVRINAEDPARDFMPSPGTIEKLAIPGGPGVRFDSAIFPNYVIPPFYDSLIGKLIVHDQSRAGALERLKRAIGELEICGIKTTKPLFVALAEEEDVRTGQIDTRWLERWLEHNPLKSAN